jgi:hypothetical protein
MWRRIGRLTVFAPVYVVPDCGGLHPRTEANIGWSLEAESSIEKWNKLEIYGDGEEDATWVLLEGSKMGLDLMVKILKGKTSSLSHWFFMYKTVLVRPH